MINPIEQENPTFLEDCRPSFRYAVINEDMIVERIEEGTPDGKGIMDPYKIFIDSEIAQEGMFYDPIRRRFSLERDPKAIASYKDLLGRRDADALKKWREKRRARLKEERKKLMGYIEEIRKNLKELNAQEKVRDKGDQ